MAASPGVPLGFMMIGLVGLLVLVLLGAALVRLLSRREAKRDDEGSLPPLRPEALGSKAAAPATPSGDTASGRTAVFTFPTLHVKDHYGLEKAYRLEFGDFHIGCGEDNDLVLGQDEGVAPRQARIRLEGSVYVLENLGSRESVRVNGSPVDRHPLKNDDVIALGKTTVRVTGLSA